MSNITAMTTESDLEKALQADVAVIYKHSTQCGVSAAAYEQIHQFVAKHSDTPVFMIDVLQHRSVSNHVADHFGIRHQSPQVIVLRGGQPAWNASHYRVTAEALEAQLRT